MTMSLPHDRLGDFLALVYSKGVLLWSDQGQLRFKAPKGSLSTQEIDQLRASKGAIITFLAREVTAPLTHTQLEYWNFHELGERSTSRQLASVTRIAGHLRVDVLRHGIAELVRRHAALRTRVIVRGGVPVQVVNAKEQCELEVTDLSTRPPSHQQLEMAQVIEETLMRPIEVAVDMLFAVRLLKLSAEEHILIVAMNHIISDAHSMGVLLRDLFMSYAQIVQGRPIELPRIGLQLHDYAIRQKRTHQAWLDQHRAYWNERLRGCRRLRFPDDPPATPAAGWSRVPLRIGSALKASLTQWARSHRTTLVMAMAAVYAGLVLRWCGATDTVIQFQSDGRLDPDVENTVGYFAAALFLRVQLPEQATFAELVLQVTQEYCNAYEHADCSYLGSQVPRPEFARNTAFNWVPRVGQGDLSALRGTDSALDLQALPVPNPELQRLDHDHEPAVVLFEVDDDVVGYVAFPLNRFSVANMEHFTRSLLTFVHSLLTQPDKRVADVVLSRT